ncbi:hypothetical protein A3A66_04885 [Microgenomates group bacterium RIFCSPLOWO2_01_FULL_46_13]|nr:MAG: hypothetical protein A2783_02280 [Microgenomates group bacterium RIFCSPHIGHO2_01_FULL_45_11]OGV94298.1 MAG: hypothetical protein A3A66_04885 [Microgenomates group bacterium RIFCSPLOWO2_01_FULL_46_13]
MAVDLAGPIDLKRGEKLAVLEAVDQLPRGSRGLPTAASTTRGSFTISTRPRLGLRLRLGDRLGSGRRALVRLPLMVVYRRAFRLPVLVVAFAGTVPVPVPAGGSVVTSEGRCDQDQDENSCQQNAGQFLKHGVLLLKNRVWLLPGRPSNGKNSGFAFLLLRFYLRQRKQATIMPGFSRAVRLQVALGDKGFLPLVKNLLFFVKMALYEGQTKDKSATSE